MLRRIVCFFFCIICMLLLASCRKKNLDDDLVLSMKSDTSDLAGLIIQDGEYFQDGISANYPIIISGPSQVNVNELNRIIETDFNKIVKIYSFHPFPEITPFPSMPVIILTIKDTVKMNNGRLFSVLYQASYHNPYSAYPTEMIYTTNIDAAKGKRLILSDMIKINKDFVKYFKTWNYQSYDVKNKEIEDAIKDYLKNFSEEDLLLGFKAADKIGSENHYGIFSYLTPDGLGITLSVPNYLGDHIEFEKNYSELEDYLIKQ